MKFITFQLLLLHCTIAKIEIDSLYKQKVQRSLNEYVTKVTKNFAVQHESLNLYFENILISSTFYDPLLCELAKTHSYKVINISNSYLVSFNDKLLQIKNTNYLIETSSYNNFITSINILSNYRHWNPTAYFLIFSYTHFLEPNLISYQILSRLHQEGILKGVILLLEGKNSTTLNVYTTRIFNKNMNRTFIDNSCSFGKFVRDRPLYTNKIPKNIRKLTIKIGYFAFEPYCIENYKFKLNGLEIKLLNAIADQLKIKIEYIKTESRGNVILNGTCTNAFMSLQRKTVDMLIGGYTLNTARSLYFIPTAPIFKEKMVWCVPHEYLYPKSHYLLFISITTLFFGILMLFLWILDRKRKPNSRYYKNISEIILNTWSILLGNPTRRLPTLTKMRYILVLMLLYSYYINIIITSLMTTSFIKSVRVDKYDSFKKIYYYNLTTYFAENTIDFFKNRETDGVSDETIVNKEIFCNDHMHCLKKVAEGSSAFFLSKNRESYLHRFLKENKTSIHCFGFVDNVYVTGIMRKGFVFIEQFNKIINQLLSAGIIEHWKQEIFMRQKDEVEQTLEKLNIEHIKDALYILAGGHIISFVVFLLEICCRPWKQSRM